MDRMVNIGLRGMTLVSKFLLIISLAAFLEPKELGLYGLLTATISFAIYPLGFDFYTYTTRELIKRDRSEWGGLLRDQGVLHLVLYALVMPLLLLVFSMELLPWHLVGWFFALLVVEHLNQELMRLLVAMSQQLAASWVLFLRSGAWAIAITVWLFLDPEVRKLEVVLLSWTLGGLLALTVAALRLAQLNLAGWLGRVNWHWMISGVKVALPFLASTLAIRAVFTIDRYWFGALQGLEVLGAYVLFMGIANALLSFLDAGVFAFSYPNLIAAHDRDAPEVFRAGLFRMLWQTLLLTALFVFISLLVIKPVLLLLDKPFYTSQISLFPWVLVAIMLYAIGMVPHYGLYAQGRDKHIILSHLGAVAVFIPVTALLAVKTPDKAVLLGLIITFSVLLIWKTWAFVRVTPDHYYSAATVGEIK